MSNVLKVNHQEAIRSLHEKRWSNRRIARELGINRRTVSRYTSKCATISTAGSEAATEAKCAISTAGISADAEPKCAISTTGNWAGRKSQCEPMAERIAVKVEHGLSAQRIYQDLVEEAGFAGSYESVKRYVGRMKATQPGRVWRMECQPGEEMQVDFGLGAPIEGDNGKWRRSWVFRVVLSYSRKGYSEAVRTQDTETFLRCMENAVRHFGGAPLLANIDYVPRNIIQIMCPSA